jgi:hypothetical protein
MTIRHRKPSQCAMNQKGHHPPTTNMRVNSSAPPE